MAKILLLEPDNLLAGTLGDYFANANHQVSAYSEAQAALAAADKRKPDIVIANLQLAGRSGIEFLYEFRSYSDWQNIPVILIGGRRSEEMAQYSEVFNELNISSYFYKPEVLLKRLLEAAEQSFQQAVK